MEPPLPILGLRIFPSCTRGWGEGMDSWLPGLAGKGDRLEGKQEGD